MTHKKLLQYFLWTKKAVMKIKGGLLCRRIKEKV